MEDLKDLKPKAEDAKEEEPPVEDHEDGAAVSQHSNGTLTLYIMIAYILLSNYRKRKRRRKRRRIRTRPKRKRILMILSRLNSEKTQTE